MAVASCIFGITDPMVTAKSVTTTVSMVAMRTVEPTDTSANHVVVVALAMVGTGRVFTTITYVTGGSTVTLVTFAQTFLAPQNRLASSATATGFRAQGDTASFTGPARFTDAFHFFWFALSVTRAVDGAAKLVSAWPGRIFSHKTFIAPLGGAVFSFPPNCTSAHLFVHITLAMTRACLGADRRLAYFTRPPLLAGTWGLDTNQQFLIVAGSMT